MLNITKETNTWMTRFFICAVTFFLVFTTVVVMNTAKADAATAIEVSNVKFSKKSFDVTQGRFG